MGPHRYGRQKLDPRRDAEPELEAVAVRKLHREELPWPNVNAFFWRLMLFNKCPGY